VSRVEPQRRLTRRPRAMKSTPGRNHFSATPDAKGTVIFTMPKGGTIRDTGSEIHFSPHDEKAKELAQNLAQIKWGPSVDRTGQSLKRKQAEEMSMATTTCPRPPARPCPGRNSPWRSAWTPRAGFLWTRKKWRTKADVNISRSWPRNRPAARSMTVAAKMASASAACFRICRGETGGLPAFFPVFGRGPEPPEVNAVRP